MIEIYDQGCQIFEGKTRKIHQKTGKEHFEKREKGRKLNNFANSDGW